MAIRNKWRGSKTPPNNQHFDRRTIASNIDVKKQNSFIYLKGERIRVFKTMFCPNRKSLDGAEHQIDCPLCYGREFIDLDPKDSFMKMQGLTKEYKINQGNMGTEWEEATANCTFLPDANISYYTRVELVDHTEPFKELVQRQLTNAIILPNTIPASYDAQTGVIQIQDNTDLTYLRINDVLIDTMGIRFLVQGPFDNTCGQKNFSIPARSQPNFTNGFYVIRQNTDRLRFKGVTCEVPIVDQNGVLYYPTQDFKIDRNGDVEWLTGQYARKPADKLIYTILYETFVAYRAIRAIHSNRYSTNTKKVPEIENVEHPSQWVLKKLFLFRKEDSVEGMKLLPNHNFPKGKWE